MEISAVLFATVILLSATSFCVLFFEKLGFGSILGFIIAGIFAGPYTPGPVPVRAVDELQSIAEFGVVLFMFVVGLEMQPKKVWAMRRNIFGLGSAQMLLTAFLISSYLVYWDKISWNTAIIVGLGLSMSSTALVMGVLGERNETNSSHGQVSFSILMAQDLWIVPIMALIPALAQQVVSGDEVGFLPHLLQVIMAIMAIFLIGRYILPFLLNYCGKKRQMTTFAMILFLAVIVSALLVEHVGISMTLGTFFLGMLLSGSDFRHQIEATVSPIKNLLMGLFFIAVGMAININALFQNWTSLLIHIPAILIIKVLALIALTIVFGIKRKAAIRTAFYLSQSGEFAFVLLGVAASVSLLNSSQHTFAMLVVAISMVTTPFMVKIGVQIADHIGKEKDEVDKEKITDSGLIKHVVIVGFNEVGQLIALMLKSADIPHIIFDRDIDIVRLGRKQGWNIHYGNLYNASTQKAASLQQASAIYITSQNSDYAKSLSITLNQLYPEVSIFVRVQTLSDQDYLTSKGITNPGTGYIESTLARGGFLLKSMGLSEDEVKNIIDRLQSNKYELVRQNFLTIQSTQTK